jgi:hypothetical protein
MTKTESVLIAAVIVAACRDTSIPPAAPPALFGITAMGEHDSPRRIHVSGPFGGGRRAGFAAGDPDTTHAIAYHGGPVIYTPKIAVLYWANRTIYQGGPIPPTTGDGSTDGSLMGFFLNNLAGSPYQNILTTYFGGTGTYVQNTVNYTRFWATNRVAPAPGDTAHEGDVDEVLEFGFNTDSLPYDPDSTIYVVVTDSAVDWGLANGFFEAGAFCAFHGVTTVPGYGTVSYAVIPHQYDTAHCTPEPGSPNNDPAADAALTALVHEMEETTTDPNVTNGWYDNGPYGQEIADKCVRLYEPHYPAENGAHVNVHLGGGNGKDVYIQRMWKNVDIQQCAFFSLTTSGPTNPQTAGTYVWTANPGGSPLDYTYKWYSRDQGGSIWNALGTSQAESLYLDGSGPNFTLLDSATNSVGQAQSDTLFVYSPPSITISGPGLIQTKGTYTFTTTITNFGGTPSYHWYERFCDGASCPGWSDPFVTTSTYRRTLSPDCGGDGLKNYQLQVNAVYGSQSATGYHTTYLCVQAPNP